MEKDIRVGILTLGCKVNQYESEAIAEALADKGFSVLSHNAFCDAYIVNTCTVTAESDRKARQMIRRMMGKNPEAYILVTGCYSQVSPDDVAAIAGVDYICGSSNKMSVVDKLCELVQRSQKNDKAEICVPDLKNSITSQTTLPVVKQVDSSFVKFIETSKRFDEVFLADTVSTGDWFFQTLQPAYNDFCHDMTDLNSALHKELQDNSVHFDASFYRSIIPGVICVSAGLLLVMLLMYFTIANYVNPIYKIAEGLNAYKSSGKRYGYQMEGDDHLADINSGVTEIIEENIELKHRVKSLKEDR